MPFTKYMISIYNKYYRLIDCRVQPQQMLVICCHPKPVAALGTNRLPFENVCADNLQDRMQSWQDQPILDVWTLKKLQFNYNNYYLLSGYKQDCFLFIYMSPVTGTVCFTKLLDELFQELGPVYSISRRTLQQILRFVKHINGQANTAEAPEFRKK